MASFFFSLLFHIIFFYLFLKKNEENNEVYVLELGQYQQNFRPEILKKKTDDFIKNDNEPVTSKKNKKVVDENEIDEKKIKNLIAEKPNLVKKEEINSSQDLVNDEVFDEISDSQKQVQEKQEKLKTESNFDKDLFLEKKNSVIATERSIINEKLAKYLRKISLEINRIAHKSYPKQSIRRREEGTINSIITLNRKGELFSLMFENSRPKRLKDATEKIIKNYNFPKPPEAVLNKKGQLKIKIPVNFILQ